MFNTINYEPFVPLQLHVKKQKLIRKSCSICHKTLKTSFWAMLEPFCFNKLKKELNPKTRILSKHFPLIFNLYTVVNSCKKSKTFNASICYYTQYFYSGPLFHQTPQYKIFPHFESVLSLYTAITSCEKNRRFPGNGFLLNLKNKLKITFKKVLLVFTELWQKNMDLRVTKYLILPQKHVTYNITFLKKLVLKINLYWFLKIILRLLHVILEFFTLHRTSSCEKFSVLRIH